MSKQAFPSIEENIVIPQELRDKYPEIADELMRMKIAKGGMSMREYYASQALQGFFSGVPFDADLPMTQADEHYLQEVARVCFKMADAMLTQSEKK